MVAIKSEITIDSKWFDNCVYMFFFSIYFFISLSFYNSIIHVPHTKYYTWSVCLVGEEKQSERLTSFHFSVGFCFFVFVSIRFAKWENFSFILTFLAVLAWNTYACSFASFLNGCQFSMVCAFYLYSSMEIQFSPCRLDLSDSRYKLYIVTIILQ